MVCRLTADEPLAPCPPRYVYGGPVGDVWVAPLGQAWELEPLLEASKLPRVRREIEPLQLCHLCLIVDIKQRHRCLLPLTAVPHPHQVALLAAQGSRERCGRRVDGRPDDHGDLACGGRAAAGEAIDHPRARIPAFVRSYRLRRDRNLIASERS